MADCTNTASNLLPLNMYRNAGGYIAKTSESKPNRKEKLRQKIYCQVELGETRKQKGNSIGNKMEVVRVNICWMLLTQFRECKV